MLDCIFADKEIRNALGAAQQLKEIASARDPPAGLLKLLKQGPGAHLKAHYYEYVKAIKTEIAHVQRIQDLQQRVVALLGTAIISISVGIANFLSTIIYNYITYEKFFPRD